MQHSLCTWEVTYNNMVDAGELTEQSRLIDKIISEWINQIEESQRQQFIQAIYKILVSCDANSVADLTEDWKNTAGGIINALINLDKPTKKLLGKIIGDLFKTARDNIGKRNEIKKESSHAPH
jgi:ribonucleotide reductase beta subunit family protein with ferritin-like domain